MARKHSPPVTERSLFYWVVTGNTRLQLALIAVILLVVVARVIPLEMQKRIINDSIALREFDNLIIYTVIYLAAVTSASGLKLIINYLQAVIGEKAMVAMRRELYHHILTLPLSFFRKTQPGMVVSSLVTELSTAGTFAGMALAVPITNVLTLLALAGYLMWLNPKLALATLGIYPMIVFLLPKMQKKANIANAERVDLSRQVASQITESVTGIHEVQVHGAYSMENSKFDILAETLRKIRVRWSLLRFGIKTTNNFFISLGPFIVFIFGGYLVMTGDLQLGAMVAFLSAQEKLYDPWKELIDFYQVYQDAKVRYSRTMDHFSVEPDFDPQAVGSELAARSGRLEVRDLVFETAEGTRLLDGVSLDLAAGEHLAMVGFSGSGKSTLVQCIAKMHQFTSGTIEIDGTDLAEMTKKDIITNIGYISQGPFVFTGTIQENLIYAEQAVYELGEKQAERKEYAPPTLDRLIMALQQSGLFVDVMRFGLESTLDVEDTSMIDKIIRIRKSFRENFGVELADYVELYQKDSYLLYSSIADNIIFGASGDRQFRLEELPADAGFRKFMESVELVSPLLDLGVELARQTTDILTGFDTVEMFFKYSPVPADKLEECREVLERLKHSRSADLPKKDQDLLLTLALRFIPGLHKTATLSGDLKRQVLSARRQWGEWSSEHHIGDFIQYDVSEYIYGQSLLNNIFFGRARTDLPHAREKINQAIFQLLIEEDCLEEIASIGMEFQVGSMGDRLSGGQRQKLAIARVLLKQPPILIMDEATSALDNTSQARIQRLMETRWRKRKTVVSVVHRLDSIKEFDKVAVMKAGKLVEFGPYAELMERKGVLHELVTGKR